MRRLLLPIVALWAANALAQTFSQTFCDSTLRIDYTLTGNAQSQQIAVDGLSQLPHWAGRTTRLDELPLFGNGQVTMRSATSHEVLYTTSFSTLFQEWLETDEAKEITRSYECVQLLPMPRETVEVEISLTNSYRDTLTTMTHRVDPQDLLIRRKGEQKPEHVVLHRGTIENPIDVAILPEGYTSEEMSRFLEDARITCEALFDHEPFKEMQSRFNIAAVLTPSAESGVSVPKQGHWVDSAFGAHFSTFYSDRYLTSSHLKDIHDALAGIDYEHIIVLVNTETYGGGGIYNMYELTAAHHKNFRPVVVHEFGHSFGGLADEYWYENDIATMSYPAGIEPWEPNITTGIEPQKKWMKNCEGGGYVSKGVWRYQEDCRMRTNEFPEFCPACQKAIQEIIRFYTE